MLPSDCTVFGLADGKLVVGIHDLEVVDGTGVVFIAQQPGGDLRTAFRLQMHYPSSADLQSGTRFYTWYPFASTCVVSTVTITDVDHRHRTFGSLVEAICVALKAGYEVRRVALESWVTVGEVCAAPKAKKEKEL
jgi:hypothetical protein